MPTFSGKIIGGTRSQSGQFPYTVSIKANNGSATSSSFCGGSVIGQTWIMTAVRPIKKFSSADDIFKFLLGTLHERLQVLRNWRRFNDPS